MTLQTKLIEFEKAAVEAKEDGAIEGYGSIFGNVDQGGDVVVKGAFGKSLKERPKIKMLWSHDSFSPPIGVWTDVSEDSKGLFMKGRIFTETERGKEIHTALKNGAVDGLSIGYQVVKQKETKKVRELQELKLFEVSVVNFPMNEEATATAGSLIEGNYAGFKRLVEKAVRDAGFHDEARAAAAVCAEKVKEMRDAPDPNAVMANAFRGMLKDIRGLSR